MRMRQTNLNCTPIIEKKNTENLLNKAICATIHAAYENFKKL